MPESRVTRIPNPDLPRLWCDFNGQDEDGNFWILDTDTLKLLPATEGMRVVIFDYDNVEEIVIAGCEATLAWATAAYQGAGHWIATPDETTWYSGPTYW